MPNKLDKWLLIVLLLVGLALRLAVLTRDPLHQDEALYGFWGRLIGSGKDVWLAAVPVDKPPLHPCLVAVSLTWFGASRFAIRLPGLAASLLSVSLVYVLVRRLYPGEGYAEQFDTAKHTALPGSARYTALTAAAVMALSPYPVLFGATALTDSTLVLWTLAACYAAATGHWVWAGVTWGLALATKQQAVILIFLVLGLGVRNQWRGVARMALGLGGVLAGLLGWETVRWGQGATVSFWEQGVRSYGGLRLIRPAELMSRLRDWLSLSGYVWATPLLSGLFVAGLGALTWRALTRARMTRTSLTDLILLFCGLFYLLVHWLIAFPVWDRYLLPLVPVVAVLAGRLVSLSLTQFTTYRLLRFTFYALLTSLLFSSGLAAAQARIPVGGDHGAYDGLERVVTYLRELPVGTVVYDRWLSWHYDFYLFDAHVYRAGFPTVDWLAADVASHHDGQPRYLLVPSWESSARIARQLNQVGFGLTAVLASVRRDGATSFTLYQIDQISQ